MSLRLTLVAIALFMLAFLPGSPTAEQEPNDSLLDPELIGAGTVNGTVRDDADIDVFRIDVLDDTLLFLSLEKTDNQSGQVQLTSFNEDREEMWEPSFAISTPGAKMSADLQFDNKTSLFFQVHGNGSYSLKTHTVVNEDSAEGEEIAYGETIGSVGIYRWEGLEVEDSDTYDFYPEGSFDITITKDDARSGTITMTLYIGYADTRIAEVSEEGDSETLSVSYWDYYESIEIEIEGEGNYTLTVAEPGAVEPDVLCCFVGITMISILIFLGILGLVIFLVVRSSRKKDAPRPTPPAPAQQQWYPPRTAQTPPPPSDPTARP